MPRKKTLTPTKEFVNAIDSGGIFTGARYGEVPKRSMDHPDRLPATTAALAICPD